MTQENIAPKPLRILYGVQGTGNGHLARARALVPELRKQGISLDFIFTGRAREDFFNMEVFGDNWRVFEGASLVTHQGKLDTFKTVTQNNLIQLLRDIKALKLDQYDLVISDFEPVTAWAAKLKGKPCLSISHQAAFYKSVPQVSGFLSSRLLMQFFAPSDYQIGLHWHHFNQQVLPPLIEPLQGLPCKQGKYLVYMGFEALPDIVSFLKPFTDKHFEVFAKVDKVQQYGHITVNPLSHEAFHHHLLDAEGVISNAGFELASECLHLGKKLLVKPLLGQFEQLSNALALQTLGRATVIESLDCSVLEQWLALPARQSTPYPNVAKAIGKWLAEGALRQDPEHRNFSYLANIDALYQQLWPVEQELFNYDEQFGSSIRMGMVV